MYGDVINTRLITVYFLNYVVVGEPPAPQLEHLLTRILELYQKLISLGFTYYNGQVKIIDQEEDKKRV